MTLYRDSTRQLLLNCKSCRCPICRKEVAIPNGDVKNFPKHNMIENLIRILTLNKEKETKLCDGCGNRGLFVCMFVFVFLSGCLSVIPEK